MDFMYYNEEFAKELALLNLTEKEFSELQNDYFHYMNDNEPKEIIPNLIKKYLNKNNPIGDLARDSFEDGAVGPYMDGGLEPLGYFDYVSSVCCYECLINALEPLRKKYNKIVGPDSPWRVLKFKEKDGEYDYEYAWIHQWRKLSTIEKYNNYLKNFIKNKL